MLNHIIEFSVKNKLIIGLCTLALIIFGIFEVRKLPIDAVPDITNNQVQIITVAPSYGATDIERLVTFPIEQAHSNIAGIEEIRSYSRFGLSLVTLVFEDQVDIYWARQQVAERLTTLQVEIPKEIGTPSMGPISTGLGEVYQYVVKTKPGYAHRYDITELRSIQDWVIRRQLLSVKGVAEVSSFGGKLKQYEIAVNPNKLQSYGITINDVFKALENNNQNTGGAYIEKNNTVLYIRSEGLIGSKEDIENIAIKSTQQSIPLFIRDVADIKIGFATRYGALTYNNEGEVSGAIVMMLKGENSNEVVANIKKSVAEIQKNLPEGVVIEPFLDRTTMVNKAIKTVETNLLEGALIVLFVLVLFLGNLRAGFLVASVIPLSMLFAIIMMNLFGVSGNLMSLGALDFGLIVDGAVIIVEAVMHQLSRNTHYLQQNRFSQKQMDYEVKAASSKMMNSAVFGQIIILIVYLPIFSLQGIEGKMFKPMAQTVAFALLGAFILSLTYIPMMSSLVLSKKISLKSNWSDRIMEKLGNKYVFRLSQVMKYPKTLIAGMLSLFGISIFILSQLGGEFIPSIEEGDFAVEMRVLSGSNLSTTIENTQKVSKLIKDGFPEVLSIVTKIGSSEVPTEPLPMDMGDMIITLKDKKHWTSAKTFDELAEKMGQVAQQVPGITTSFQFPVQMRFNELLTGARQDVVCKIFGEDLDSLALYAKKVGALANTVKGTSELYVETVSGIPQIVINYNRAALAQFDLNINDVNRVVNAAFAGQKAGEVFEGEKRFDLTVRLAQEQRSNLNDVQSLLVPTPKGTQVPLSQLAKVELINGPNQIQREDTKRRILVGFNIRNRDVESVVHELQAKVESQLRLPVGYTVKFGGAFENLNEAKARLSVAVPLALALIFLLLYFAFHSLKYSLLIYTAIPLSAIGGILFLALRGMPFSISAGVGFIALFGIAVLNGIVLIAEFLNLKKAGETELKEIILKGSKTRLRPILMTAFVASLGFLPMAISNGAGASVQRPLATVVIGGLMLSTFLTLFLLPVLFMLFEKMPTIKPKILMPLLLLISLGGIAQAQQPLDFKQALDTAMANNLQLKNEKLLTQYQQTLIKTAKELPKTQLGVEYGQMNSAQNDTKFNINQSFQLPGVYQRKKALFTEQYEKQVIKHQLSHLDLEKTLTAVFYAYLVNEEKLKLIQKIDSNYLNFLNKSELRLKYGESNILEQSTAQLQLSDLQMKKRQLLAEQERLLMQFRLILNSNQSWVPTSATVKLNFEDSPTEVSLSEHPELKIARAEINAAKAQVRVAQAALWPEFNIGYNNASMATGLSSGAGPRYHSAQLGLSIPLFQSAQRAAIQSERQAAQIAQNNAAWTQQQLQQQLNAAFAQYRENKSLLEYLERYALSNAQTINSTLGKQLAQGEINYLEWVVLNNQALNTQLNYLDVLQNLNENIIELNYLLAKDYEPLH